METALAPSTGTLQTATPHDVRRERLEAHYALIRQRYTLEQIDAVSRLYQAAREMLDTSGGSSCAKLLLGLYNGRRFPFDLTDLRVLDGGLYAAARVVIDMDARCTYCEVHELLNAIYADGRSVGAELETWAYRLRWGKRAKKDGLSFDFGPKWTREGGVQ